MYNYTLYRVPYDIYVICSVRYVFMAYEALVCNHVDTAALWHITYTRGGLMRNEKH